MVRTESFKDLCHGTTADSAEKIRKDGFVPSKAHDSWCGAGIYFYDIKAKAWWSAGRTCEEISKATGKKVKPAVVFADIIDIPRTDIFDLRAPADMKEFMEFVSPVFDDINKLCIDGISDEQERVIMLRSMLISYYAEANDKKLIVGIFEQREQPLHSQAIEFATGLRLILGAETIYCARDNSILTNIR